jgi:hypothetical protein|eukprot:COSAG06_NODE_221_length_19912_cov_17.460875_13_plen_169_part_00
MQRTPDLTSRQATTARASLTLARLRSRPGNRRADELAQDDGRAAQEDQNQEEAGRAPQESAAAAGSRDQCASAAVRGRAGGGFVCKRSAGILLRLLFVVTVIHSVLFAFQTIISIYYGVMSLTSAFSEANIPQPVLIPFRGELLHARIDASQKRTKQTGAGRNSSAHS